MSPEPGYTSVPQNLDYRLAHCNRCAAIVSWSDVAAHNNFHAGYITRQEERTLSSAAWCDKGNHAFKAGEPGSESGQMTIRDEEGNPRTVQQDSCAEHSFLSEQKRARALEAARATDV